MKRVLLLCGALLMLLTGCQEEPHIETPSEVVVKHFEALYNQDDLEVAMSYASSRHRKLMQSYGTPRSVGRYLYNMSYEDVEINVQAPMHSAKQNSQDDLRLNVAIVGFNGEQHFENIRIAVMTLEEGRWKLERLLSTPY